MNKMIMVAFALTVFSIESFAKITIFSNEQVIKHVLSSPELKNLKKNSELKGLKLFNSGIKKNGNGGIGTIYDVTLSYRHGGMMLTVCGVTGRVVNQKSNAFVGVTASHLSKPVFSEVRCAY